MQDNILIHEFRWPGWRYLIIGLSLLTLLLGSGWLFGEDVFWTGIFRFLTFACFAGLVLAGLRIRQPPLTIRIEVTSEQLIIHYFLDDEEKKEELFERDTIKNIERIPAVKWNFWPHTQAYKFTISFNDTDNTLSTFIYSGRAISINEKDAKKFESFLRNYSISCSSG